MMTAEMISTGAHAASATDRASAPRVLSFEAAALPEEWSERTDVADLRATAFFHRLLKFCPLAARSRLDALRCAWRFLRQSKHYPAIITLGDLSGLLIAFLNRLFGRRPVHVMYDCLWYGGGALKRRWMRFCIENVDRCVVWSSIECDRYAEAYGTNVERFIFVPHHHTIKNYSFEIADDGYMFAGGNWSRDYRLLIEAIKDVPFPCVIATNRKELLSNVVIPAHVKVVSATSEEFRQLMARSTFVVLPLVADHLHAPGQQSIVNAMAMGKPVIATDMQGARDYIHQGEDGFLVPYPDVQVLTRAIRHLVDDRQACLRMGQRARAFALPLTTVACNGAIWREAVDALQSRPELRETSVRTDRTL